MNEDDKRIVPALIVYLLIAAAAILLVLYFTRNGPGITGDSVHYVMGAENLLLGRGFSRTGGAGEALPITGFPPGTSAVLAVVGFFEDDLFQGARLLNSFLFGVNVFLVAYLVRRITGSFWIGLVAGLLVMLSEDMILVHAWVMSEPQYILLMILALWALTVYAKHGQRTVLLIAGALIAAATLTRYAGVSIGVTAALLLLFFGQGTVRRRIIDISLLGAVSALPVVLWFWRNASMSGTLTNRGLSYFPLSDELITAFLGTMNAWFFPLTLGLSTLIRAILSTALVITIVGLFLWYERLSSRRMAWTHKRPLGLLTWTFLLYIPAYILVLLVNSIFLDASTSAAGAARYLAPVFVSMVIMLTAMLAWLMAEGQKKGRIAWVILTIGVALIVSYTVRAADFIRDPGLVYRYTDSKRAMLEVIEALEMLDRSQMIISNDIELVYVLVDRPAYAFPISFDHYQQVYREDLDEQLEFVRGLLEEGGRIIYFGELEDNDQLLLKQLGAVEARSFDGATLYRSGGTER
jgi:4-amino-4-deoxy-L-arabinose transferase-like glycosyltransferase